MVALKPRPTTPGPTGPPGADGPTGPAGADGPPGPAGGTYLHTQNVPASVWTVVHNLGFRPNVTVIDSAGTTVHGDVEYPDLNTVVLRFAVPFGGTATAT